MSEKEGADLCRWIGGVSIVGAGNCTGVEKYLVSFLKSAESSSGSGN